jgi:hypothetical protein
MGKLMKGAVDDDDDDDDEVPLSGFEPEMHNLAGWRLIH